MAETKTTTAKTKKSKLFPNEPLVTINIPITRFEKDAVWVAVNGKSMQIKRGIDVEVPRCVALALEDSQNMLINAIEKQEALEHKDKMLIEAIEAQEALSGKASADELN